jgi:hypothetical protein
VLFWWMVEGIYRLVKSIGSSCCFLVGGGGGYWMRRKEHTKDSGQSKHFISRAALLCCEKQKQASIFALKLRLDQQRKAKIKEERIRYLISRVVREWRKSGPTGKLRKMALQDAEMQAARVCWCARIVSSWGVTLLCLYFLMLYPPRRDVCGTPPLKQ